MIWDLDYEVEFELTDADDYEFFDEIWGIISENSDFKITEDIEDIIEYLVRENYHQEYSRDMYIYDAEVKDYVKSLYEQWNNNELDTLSLYANDYRFKEFLKDKYAYKFGSKLESEVESALDDELRGRVWIYLD